MATQDLSSQITSQSSTLVRVSPTVRRLRAIVSELGEFVMTVGDERQRRMQRLLNIVVDEAMEELGTVPEDSLMIWMSNMARVIQWSATGDMSILPEDLIPFACKVEGIPEAEFIARMAASQPDDDVAEAELLPLESAER
jgi:hypothetical protein